MELRQLEYFLEIANTGSINEAARRLNMSQPPLSYQMRQLESELGVRLFERTSKGVVLTEAGKLLYNRADGLLDHARSTRLEVAKAGKKRVLRIGLTPTTVETMMPCLSAFARKNPDANFEVHDGITYTLYRYLIDGLIDLSVVRTPLRLDEVEYTVLRQEPMIAVSSIEMQAEKEGALRLSDLLGRPLILYRRYEQLIMDAFRAGEMEPDVFCRCDDAETRCSGPKKDLRLRSSPSRWRASAKECGSRRSKRKASGQRSCSSGRRGKRSPRSSAPLSTSPKTGLKPNNRTACPLSANENGQADFL